MGSHVGAHAAGGKVAAPMPGRVVKVAAKEGDTVSYEHLMYLLQACLLCRYLCMSASHSTVDRRGALLWKETG